MLNEIEKLYSEDVEQNILGCMLVFKECNRYIKNIEENDFYININKLVFKLIKELKQEDKPIEILSVKEIAKSKDLDEKELFNYLIKITSNSLTSSNIDFYIKRLKSYSIRRKIIEKARTLIDEMYQSENEEAEEIKKNAIQTITNIKTNSTSTTNEDMKTVMIEALEDIENKYRNRDDHKYKTGFFELDKVTDGLHEQEFTIIAARPRSR
ncbi:MAG: DnaB-like helicase N-terminal domain-containing protein [Clostridia bacterium]